MCRPSHPGSSLCSSGCSSPGVIFLPARHVLRKPFAYNWDLLDIIMAQILPLPPPGYDACQDACTPGTLLSSMAASSPEASHP